MPILIDLFFTFAKVGLFAFGGGYAMLSLIENACVEEEKWISLIPNRIGFPISQINSVLLTVFSPLGLNAGRYFYVRKGGNMAAIRRISLHVNKGKTIAKRMAKRIVNHAFVLTYVRIKSMLYHDICQKG